MIEEYITQSERDFIKQCNEYWLSIWVVGALLAIRMDRMTLTDAWDYAINYYDTSNVPMMFTAMKFIDDNRDFFRLTTN